MNCQRCADLNKTEVREYTVHKENFKQKITLCNDCALTYATADIKLTGGKQEAEPEASTEVIKEAEPELTNEAPTRKSRRY